MMGRGRNKVVSLLGGGRRPARESAADAPDAPETIEEAIALHLDAMYATARLLTGGDAAAAEDLVQESALSAVRSWGSLRAPAAAKAWLLRILYRSFLSAWRYRQRRPNIVDIDLEELIEHSLVEDIGGSDDVLDVELSEEMAAALERLPPGYREVVWLVDVEELTLAEVADVLALPPGTVASRVYRARAKLREQLRAAAERKGGT